MGGKTSGKKKTAGQCRFTPILLSYVPRTPSDASADPEHLPESMKDFATKEFKIKGF